MRAWLAAFGIALLLAVGRLVADALIPPHLQWWFTPFIALQASLLTSALWILAHRRAVR